jgi:hypothetical protein
MNLGLHGLMIAVMAWTMLVAVSGASALLGAVVLIAASVPCALVARRSASGWRQIVAATSALPAISRLAASPLTSSAVMGGMAHGVAMSLASPSGLALAVVAAWLTCRLALTAGAVRRGERMARLGLGSAVVTAAGLGLMLAFH